MKDAIAAVVAEAEAEAKGHEYMTIVIVGQPRRKRWPRARVQVAAGLRGSLVNEQDRAGGRVDLVVEVAVADAKAWLRRRT